MIYEGEEYELVPYEELSSCVGEEVLMYRESIRSGGLMEIAGWEGNTLLYATRAPWSGCSHCAVDRCFYVEPESWCLPYRRVHQTGLRFCRCNGPGEDKRCFDTFKVEKVCVRCHFRKRG